MLIQIENANLQSKAQVQVHIKILFSLYSLHLHIFECILRVDTGDEVSTQ